MGSDQRKLVLHAMLLSFEAGGGERRVEHGAAVVADPEGKAAGFAAAVLPCGENRG